MGARTQYKLYEFDGQLIEPIGDPVMDAGEYWQDCSAWEYDPDKNELTRKRKIRIVLDGFEIKDLPAVQIDNPLLSYP